MAYADLPPGTHAEDVRCHWWRRPGWSDDSQFYTWHVTFEHATELHRLVACYQRKLGEFPGLALVDQPGLHLTMQGVGFVDQVADDTLTAVTDAVRRKLRDVPPFDLVFRSATVADEAIVLPPADAADIARVRQLVRESVQEVFQRQDVPDADASRFRPHVSLAYVNDDGPARPYVEAVTPLDPEPATVPVREVSLIALRREGRAYAWDTKTVVPVGS